MRHLLSVDQLSNEDIYAIIHEAETLRIKQEPFTNQLFAANLFYEPSTRTKMSFTVAERKLGMDVLEFHKEASSVKKGETLYDTARTFEAIGTNLLVVRHPENNWYEDLADNISIPMINAGAGTGEHPTQCMLDLSTIYQEFNQFEGLQVVIAGDIKHSRVAKSNAKALDNLGAEVFLSPMDGCESEELDFPNVSMDEASKFCDVLMLLRIQHERHDVEMAEQKDVYHRKYGLTLEREKKMKKHAIILHPAPVNRDVEIASSLVECARSRIFKQMENGVYVRMSIIKLLLENWERVSNVRSDKQFITHD